MNIGLNDLPFTDTFSSKQEVVDRLHELLVICQKIERGEAGKKEKIITVDIDKYFEIAPKVKIVQVLQEFQTVDEKRYLFGLLANRGKRLTTDSPFLFDGKKSILCAKLKDGIIVSLISRQAFLKEQILGEIGTEKVEIDNIATLNHLYLHRKKLGLRCYEANSGKHKKNKKNPYGKGKTASCMDLENDAAQILLNHAVEIGGRLYAKKCGKYYAFQNHRDILYHGYQVDDLPENVRRQIDVHKWD